MNTSNYHLQLKENIQSLTLATINLDKKYEEKFKKLSDSVDIEKAQEILIEIKKAIETTTDQLKKIESIIENYTNVPTDIEKLKKNDTDLQKQIDTNTSDISDNKEAIDSIKNDINGNNGNNGIKDSIDAINQRLVTDEAIIGNLRTTVGNNSTDITNLQTEVGVNSTDIKKLQTDVSSNKSNIKNLQTEVSSNIENLQTDMNLKANTSDVYTKTQINDLLASFYKIYKPITTNDFSSSISNLTLPPLSLTKLLKYPISLPSLSINNLQFMNMEISGNILYNSSGLDFETSNNFMAVSFAGNILPLPAIVSYSSLIDGNNYEVKVSFHENYNFSYDFRGSIEIMFFNINHYSITITNIRNFIYINRYGYYL